MTSKQTVKNLAVLDTETTGLRPGEARVVQYGLVLVTLPELDLIATKATFVDPQKEDSSVWDRADPRAFEVHGLTPEELAPAPASSEAVRYIVDAPVDWEETVLAGWGVDFDEGFLRMELQRAGLPIPYRYRLFDVRTAFGALDLLTGGIEYGGLADFVERVRDLKLVRDMEIKGEFILLDQLIGLRSGREHDALVDACRTVKALKVAQRVLQIGVSGIQVARQGMLPGGDTWR